MATKKARPTRKRTIQVVRKKLDTSLERLTSAELVRLFSSDDLGYIFKHALVQDIAYESLLRHDRAYYHRAIAGILEQQYANRLDEIAARLAQHYAEAGDDAKTAEFARRAGDVASRAFANIEASANYLLALKAIARLPDSIETRQLRIDTTIRYADHVWAREDSAQVLGWLEEMEELARALPDLAGHPTGDRLRLAYIHHALGGVYFARGEITKALPYFHLVLEEAPDSSDPSLIAGPATLIGGVLIFQGHFRQALGFIEQAIAASRNFPNTWFGFGCRIYYAQALAAMGQFEKASAQMDELLAQVQETGSLSGATMCLTAQSGVLVAQGADEQAIQTATAALASADVSKDTLYKLFAYAIKSLAESHLRENTQAQQDIEYARNILEARSGRTFAGEWSAAFCAQAMFNLGEYERALAQAQTVIAMEERVSGIYASAMARRVWGQAISYLTPDDTTIIDEQFAQSVSQLTASEAVPELARTHLAWGDVLARRGEAGAAGEHFEQAATQFEAAGLATEAEQARARRLTATA